MCRNNTGVTHNDFCLLSFVFSSNAKQGSTLHCTGETCIVVLENIYLFSRWLVSQEGESDVY